MPRGSVLSSAFCSEVTAAARLTGEDNAERFVEELLPADLDWKHWVRTYPAVSLALAALGGYALGSLKGRRILGTVTGFAADTLSQHINERLGQDIL